MTRAAAYVVGTRSFAGEVADFAEEAGIDVLGLLEPYEPERIGTTIHGLPVTALEETPPGVAIIGTGERARQEIASRVEALGWELLTVVHPRAHVSRRSSIGRGSVVGPGAVVGAYTRIGEHVVTGRGVLVGHHSEICDFVTLNPGANVAGNTRVGAGAFIGMAAVVRDHVTVGASALVAAGAVVVGNVPDGVEVRGLPATVHRLLEGPPQVVESERDVPSDGC
jgi:UDP-perosamine 4-acetyltransferase